MKVIGPTTQKFLDSVKSKLSPAAFDYLDDLCRKKSHPDERWRKHCSLTRYEITQVQRALDDLDLLLKN
jgi:hypothetical protein